MKIVIDGRMIKCTGIGRYTTELLSQLQEIDNENNYIVLLLIDDFIEWKPKAPNFRKELANYPPYSWQEQVLLPIKLYKICPDLVHFPNISAPILYSGRQVLTIHDLNLIQYKLIQENVHAKRIKKLVYELKYWAMRIGLRFAVMRSHLITDTIYVRNQIVGRYRFILSKRNLQKINVVPLGANIGIRMCTAKNYYYSAPFLLYVGNCYPYKNLARLIDALKILRKTESDLRLLIIGRSDYFQEQLKKYVDTNGMSDAIVFTGYVDDEELAWLYKKTELYIFPSLSEGFGLPGLEAMAMGTPVLAARASCLPEVYGDAAAYFNPVDTKDLAEKIKSIIQNHKERDRLCKAGREHIKQFSWRRMAEKTLEIYKNEFGS